MANEIKFVLTADASGIKPVTNGVAQDFAKLGDSAKQAGATAQAGLSGISDKLQSLQNLAQGYVGFQMLQAQASAMVGQMNQASLAFDRMNRALEYASGSTAAYAANTEFVRASVRSLGLDLLSSGDGFAKLAAAAKNTSLEGAGARSIFDAVARASTVMGLTADQTSGSLLAVSQMISKGTVSAEELRGQLGERLPGAFQTAARAMGVTTQELGKMLEQGQLATDVFLPRFAAQMRIDMAGSVETAADSVQANMNRVQSGWTELLVTMNNSPRTVEILKGIDEFLGVLNGSLKKSEGDFSGWGNKVAYTLAFVGDAANSAINVVNALGHAYGGTAALTSLWLERTKALSDLTYDYSPDHDQKVKAIQDRYTQGAAAIKAGVDEVGQELLNGSSRLRDALAKQRDETAAAVNDPELKRLNERAKSLATQADQALLASKPKLAQGGGGGAGQASRAVRDALSVQISYYEQLQTIVTSGEKTAQSAIKAQHDAKLISDEDYYARELALALNANTDLQALTELELESLQRFELSSSDKLKGVEKYNGELTKLKAEEVAIHQHADNQILVSRAKTAAEIAKQLEVYDASQQKAIESSYAEVDAAQAAYDAHDKLKSVIEAESLARLELARDIIAGTEDTSVLDAQIANKKRLIDILKNGELRDVNEKAAKAADDAWQKTSDSIRDNITDAFLGATDNGKSAFENLRDAVEKMFSQMVLRPMIEAGVSTAMEAVGLSSTSSASGIMGMANTGASLLSGTSSFSLGLQGTISTIAEQGVIGGISNAFTSTTSLAAAGEFMGALGAAIPYVGAALAVVALLSSAGNDRLPSQGTGEGQLSFDATGAVTDSYSRFGEGDSNLGLTAAVNDTITALYTDYAKTAAALGIQLVDTQFSFGANTGLEGKDPQFAIGSNAGGVGYSSGEIQQTDEAIQLAASRAVFNALQQSELPKYLAGAFDGISASTATQEQITAALDGASALQSFHNQLQLLPWDGLKDMTYATTQALVDMSGGLDALQSGLGTFYENFYTDAAKTEALTTNTAAAFAALGITMPAVDEGMRDWYRTLVESVLALDQSDAANAGATVAVLSLQTAVDGLAPAFDNTTQSVTDAAAAMQDWQDKLDVATGKTTERAQQLAKDLADAADDQTRSLINQVYAAEDAAVAAQDAADAMKSLTDAIQSMADDTANIIASMADIGKTDFQKSIAQIKRDGETNQASLDALVAPAATAAATAAVAATSVTTYSGASYAYTVPAAQNDGSMGGFTAEQNASIQAYVAGLDWSAEGTAASSAALLTAMTEVGVSLEHMSNLGYSTTDLKNVASFATAQINNDYAAANPTMAYIGSNYSNWGGPAADAWSSSSYGYGSGGSATGGTSSGGAASSSIAASAAENTAAKINAAYAEQLQSMIDAYKPDTQAVDAMAALTAAGFLIDGLDASGIKKYFYDIASAADPLTEAGKATIDALDALSGQIGLLGQVAADRQAWQNKLDVLTGATTDQALQRQADLASTTDVATLAIIAQVHAQEDIAAAQAVILAKQAEALEALAKAADLLNDKLALQATLYELTGNKALAAATLAAQRAIELDSLDASLRDLTSQIWDAQDAISAMDTAMGAVERAVNGQRTSINDGATAQIDAIRASADANKASIDVAQKSVDSLKGIFDDIANAVKTLRGNVDPVTSMLQARSYIDMSLSLAEAGVMPNGDKLKDALGVVTKDSADTYSSGAEFRFAQLSQAGKLDKLNAIVGVQKTTAEQQLESLNNLNTAAADQIKAIEDARDAQLKVLDAQLKEAQDAVDTMKGIDISVMSVSEAIKALNAAINGVSDATGNPAVPVSDKTITPGGGGDYTVTPKSGVQSAYEASIGLDSRYYNTTAADGKYTFLDGILYSPNGASASISSLSNADALATYQSMYGADNITNMGTGSGYTSEYSNYLKSIEDSIKGLPGFDVGTNYVPHDMVAKLHEGEEIVPKAWNPAAGGRGGQNTERLERLVEGLTKEVQRLQTIVNDGNKQTKRVADNIDNVTEGGNAMRTRTA